MSQHFQQLPNGAKGSPPISPRESEEMKVFPVSFSVFTGSTANMPLSATFQRNSSLYLLESSIQ